MYIYYSVPLLLASRLILSPAAGEVESITYCATPPTRGADWADNQTLQLSDPNLDDLVQTFFGDFDVELIVMKPGSSSISVIASSSISEELAVFDGDDESSGRSGRNLEGMTNGGSKMLVYTDVSVFVATAPDETIHRPASANGSGDGALVPGNFVSTASGSAESQGTVTFASDPRGLGKGGI